MSVSMNQCDVCINRYKNVKGIACEAFPDGIPENIYSGEVSHLAHVENDNGIIFKQDPDEISLKVII